MPIHDWTKVPAGLFHHFHQSWSIRIADALNADRLPKGVAALVEQRAGAREDDVPAIEARSKPRGRGSENGPVATMEPPKTRLVRRTTNEIYAVRANRIVVKHHLGRTIAVIEIVSPGNKDSRAALRDFVEKTLEFLKAGIHVLVIDLFPPSPRDPGGIHKAIWDEIIEEDLPLPPGKDRVLASFETGGVRAIYVEPVSVGDALPDMPLYLMSDFSSTSRWSRHTRRHGPPALRTCASRWRPASCRETKSNDEVWAHMVRQAPDPQRWCFFLPHPVIRSLLYAARATNLN